VEYVYLETLNDATIECSEDDKLFAWIAYKALSGYRKTKIKNNSVTAI